MRKNNATRPAGPLWRKSLIATALATMALPVMAEFNDRVYLLGDDPFETSANGATVNNALGAGLVGTFDTQGRSSAGDYQDLFAFGSPVYADVSARPGSGGFGIAFDGSDDYLVAANLNSPGNSASTVGSDENEDPGPMNFSGIANRGFQLWVNPNAATQGVRQDVVSDAEQGGAIITANNTWGLVFPNGIVTDSGVAVNYGSWQHVMVVRPIGPAGPDSGARLYVDGVGIASVTGGYGGGDQSPLVVGANTGGTFDLLGLNGTPGDGDEGFTGGTANYFHGVIDDLSVFVLGDNTGQSAALPTDGNGNGVPASPHPYASSTTITDELTGEVFTAFDGAGNSLGTDWGAFDFLGDNEAVAVLGLFNGVNGDFNQDGVLDSLDLNAFIAGWLSTNDVTGGQHIGDMNSYANGDINFTGAVDRDDWALFRDAWNTANPGVPFAAAVPEPGSLALLALGGLALVRRRH